MRRLLLGLLAVATACAGSQDGAAVEAPSATPALVESAPTPSPAATAPPTPSSPPPATPSSPPPATPSSPPPPTPSPTATPTPSPTPTPAPTPTPQPAPPPPSTPTAPPLDLGLTSTDPIAVVTRTGVPVVALAITETGYVIRTPCGRTAIIEGGTPTGPIRVVIDPGHGGPVDTGAVGPNGLVERDLNLRLSAAIAADLSARGVPVVLIRTADYAVPLANRAAFADEIGAELMVSIHHNAPIANPSERPGTEVFVQSGSFESSRLGGLLYEEVVAALSQFDIEWTTAPDAGVLRVLLEDGRDAYGMIRLPTTPTALLELGYIANPAEARLFRRTEYVGAASVAVANAVVAYLTTDRDGSGFGRDPRVFRPALAPGADGCVDPLLG